MFQFLLPLLAMAGGAGLQMNAQRMAQKRQGQMAVESQLKQNQARDQATGEVMKRVQEFDPTQRGAQQQLIEQALQGDYEKAASAPAITAQGVEVGAGTGSGADYDKARAGNAAKVAESLRGLAQLMARTGSAGRLRQNEAIRIGDTAGDIGRIQSGANNMAQIDKIGIESVQPNAGMQLLGGALQGYGMGQLAGGAGQQPDHYKNWLKSGGRVDW